MITFIARDNMLTRYNYYVVALLFLIHLPSGFQANSELYYTLFTHYSAVIDFRRQNLTSVDVRFRRLKSITRIIVIFIMAVDPSHWIHAVVATLNQRLWRWCKVSTTSCVQWDKIRSPIQMKRKQQTEPFMMISNSNSNFMVCIIVFQGWKG